MPESFQIAFFQLELTFNISYRCAVLLLGIYITYKEFPNPPPEV